ncbi:hypothetical protein DVH24_000157 [Malus domestica]|uniref:STAS domain-containing protein n=1 Tax=Malus domestica TaxID=3750 RepID=A0A498IZ67_MALDO|nr:hypothetical protein DVH24_000157 [Malus domestica]
MPPLEIHRVCLPPKQTTLQKLRQRLADIFFPDNPLHIFNNQTWFTKLLLGLQFFFPIFQWGPEYHVKLLKSDFIFGFTIASLAIPQGISYAKLANSSFVPPLTYYVLGSSGHIAVGPVSIASLVMGSMLSEVVSSTEDPILYLKLAFTATCFAGLFQASLGILRFGFIIDFLSKATLVEFMAGASVIVILQQLKGLLGIVHFTTKMQFVSVMSSVITHKGEVNFSYNSKQLNFFLENEVFIYFRKTIITYFFMSTFFNYLIEESVTCLHYVSIALVGGEFQWSWQTIAMGFSFLVFLFTTRHISKTKSKLFWVATAAPLTSVIISTLVVFLLSSKAPRISVIGHLPKGFNPPSSNMLYFSGPYLALAIKTGIIIGILSLTVSSFSRSAVNYNSGAQTVVSNIIMASAMLITLLFLMPLFYYTPNVILAAIIITAVSGFIDYQAQYRLWKVDKLDFMACMCAFLGVLFISVPLGLAIAVGVSIFKILLHVTWPNTMALGNIPGTQTYHNLNRYREVSRISSFLILAVEAPIYFANSTYLQERIIRWVREEEERIKASNEKALKCIILDMTAVTAIDTSGIDMMSELRKMLEKRSLQILSVNQVLHDEGKLSNK